MQTTKVPQLVRLYPCLLSTLILVAAKASITFQVKILAPASVDICRRLTLELMSLFNYTAVHITHVSQVCSGALYSLI
jgi:hypothetical protein